MVAGDPTGALQPPIGHIEKSAPNSLRGMRRSAKSHPNAKTWGVSTGHPAPSLTRRSGTRRAFYGCRIEPRQNWRIHFSWVGVAEVIHLSVGYICSGPR